MKNHLPDNMKNLIIGIGEVGTALKAILECDGIDIAQEIPRADIIHICFPYSDKFESQVNYYKKETDAKHVCIHSTVPVGTSRLLGACHSPITGVHPHLEKSVRTFVKYFGGKDSELIANEFKNKGVEVICYDNAKTTELMKVVATTAYGVNILIAKEIHRLCEKYGVEYKDVYTQANLTYNKGYLDMGMPQFQMYNLKHVDGKIGGHCILPNIELFDSWMCDLIREKNANL